jgi:hypothetical protein
VPESHDHGVDAGGTVREVRARISATGCSPAAATTTSGHHQ